MTRNRLLVLGGAIAAAVVAVVVIVVVAGGGSSSPSTTTTAVTQPGGGTEAKSTFEGVPQRGDTLGKASAPVTLTVFEDPQCPFCRQWNIDTLPTVVQNYVRTGRIKIVYRGVVVIGDNSLVGLAAIYAAAEQDKLWQMAEALYERYVGPVRVVMGSYRNLKVTRPEDLVVAEALALAPGAGASE